VFTVRKWESLPPKTRLRKLVVLLQKAETDLIHGVKPDLPFFVSLLDSQMFKRGLSEELGERVEDLTALLKSKSDTASLRRGFNRLRHCLLKALDIEPAEWDLIEANGSLLHRDGKKILPIRVYLEDIRSPFNVGSIFRTAEAFGTEKIYLSPHTPVPTHPKALRTARGCIDVIPWEVADLSVLDDIDGVFALETGGTPIDEFSFPAGLGVALVGSEELGLSPEALSLADRKAGRVSIPLEGSKRSLNVAVAFGVLMWCWHSTHLFRTKS
jgi:TrmH family RNA methyltransferase